MSSAAPGLPSEPEAVRVAFRRRLLGLADTKRILGIRYSDWLLGAPSIEAGIAASSMAQDEWGHARLLYASLRDFDEDPTALEHERPGEAYASWDPLDRSAADWAGLVALVVVVDGALAVALEGLLEGRYEPLAGRIGKMLGEEEFHHSLGGAWFRRLSAASEEGRDRLAVAAHGMLLPATRALAPGDEADGLLAEHGLAAPGPELRDRLAARLDPLLEPLGLRVPDGEAAAFDEGWDPARGRGPGRPGEEAVERARGDRNRALFVE